MRLNADKAFESIDRILEVFVFGSKSKAFMTNNQQEKNAQATFTVPFAQAKLISYLCS